MITAHVVAVDFYCPETQFVIMTCRQGATDSFKACGRSNPIEPKMDVSLAGDFSSDDRLGYVFKFRDIVVSEQDLKIREAGISGSMAMAATNPDMLLENPFKSGLPWEQAVSCAQKSGADPSIMVQAWVDRELEKRDASHWGGVREREIAGRVEAELGVQDLTVMSTLRALYNDRRHVLTNNGWVVSWNMNELCTLICDRVPEKGQSATSITLDALRDKILPDLDAGLTESEVVAICFALNNDWSIIEAPVGVDREGIASAIREASSILLGRELTSSDLQIIDIDNTPNILPAIEQSAARVCFIYDPNIDAYATPIVRALSGSGAVPVFDVTPLVIRDDGIDQAAHNIVKRDRKLRLTAKTNGMGTIFQKGREEDYSVWAIECSSIEEIPHKVAEAHLQTDREQTQVVVISQTPKLAEKISGFVKSRVCDGLPVAGSWCVNDRIYHPETGIGYVSGAASSGELIIDASGGRTMMNLAKEARRIRGAWALDFSTVVDVDRTWSHLVVFIDPLTCTGLVDCRMAYRLMLLAESRVTFVSTPEGIRSLVSKSSRTPVNECLFTKLKETQGQVARV